MPHLFKVLAGAIRQETNKRHPIGKEEVKTILQMTLYIGNPKDYTEKLLNEFSKFSTLAGPRCS